MSLVIKNHTWYFTLVESPNNKNPLLANHKNVKNKLIVALTISDKILFGLFDNYLKFLEYSSQFKEQDRCFFEVIFGEFAQKPHFDIDIKKEEYEKHYDNGYSFCNVIILDTLIRSCIIQLEKMSYKVNIEKDVLIYCSSSEQKHSYHLVINNICHANNLEAKEFYKAVIFEYRKLLPDNLLGFENFIDESVYSAKQQFRILGSQKTMSNRPKLFLEEFTFEGQKYRHIYKEEDPKKKYFVQLYESLVGFTPYCTFLPTLTKAKKPITFVAEEVEESQVKKCLDMMTKAIKDCPFDFDRIENDNIILRRLSPSYCPICQRSHSSENPFIKVVGKDVFWFCRRSEKPFFIGNIEKEVELEKIDVKPSISIVGLKKKINPTLNFSSSETKELKVVKDEFKDVQEQRKLMTREKELKMFKY
jgi:hypothetical protein